MYFEIGSLVLPASTVIRSGWDRGGSARTSPPRRNSPPTNDTAITVHHFMGRPSGRACLFACGCGSFGSQILFLPRAGYEERAGQGLLRFPRAWLRADL